MTKTTYVRSYQATWARPDLIVATAECDDVRVIETHPDRESTYEGQIRTPDYVALMSRDEWARRLESLRASGWVEVVS